MPEILIPVPLRLCNNCLHLKACQIDGTVNALANFPTTDPEGKTTQYSAAQSLYPVSPNDCPNSEAINEKLKAIIDSTQTMTT